MTTLSHSLKHWKTEQFTQTFKNEMTTVKSDNLPIHKATTQGGIVSDSNISLTILSMDENATEIIIKVGLFFTEIVPSCSCGDDPMEINNYCEMTVTIDKANAKTTFWLINDSN